jgi:hypothetical protein
MIILRKKLLPIKYWFIKKKIRDDYGTKTPKEIEERFERENENLIVAQRMSNQEEINRQEGKIEILNWFVTNPK